jgi:protein subunit release factor A
MTMHTNESAPKDTRERVTILTAKDLDISYFGGSGNGGQNKQKTSSGVQMVHRETGAIGRASDTRCQVTNKKTAFQRLMATPKMKAWIAKKVYAIQQQETMEDAVERMMATQNLKVEVKRDGKWVPESAI